MSAVMPEAGASRGDRQPGTATQPRTVERPATASAVDAESAEPTAAERLEASRSRLRMALLVIAHPPPKPSMFDHMPALAEWRTKLLRTFRSVPGAALIVDSLESWWAQHPLHTAGIVAREASQEFVLPIARRNPFAFVATGLVLGSLLVLSKPWRWLLRPALFVGLVPQIASHALKKMPIESWMHMLSAYLAKRAPRKPGRSASSHPSPSPS